MRHRLDGAAGDQDLDGTSGAKRINEAPFPSRRAMCNLYYQTTRTRPTVAGLALIPSAQAY